MKAKTISLFLQALALIALAGALAPRGAMAQEESGKFTLPTEVRWGAAVLPAGDYSYSTDTLAPQTMLYIYRESSPAAGYVVLPQTWDRIPAFSDEDHLVLAQENGEFYVKELHLGIGGMVLRFSAPKPKK